ncbi:MAG TPA: hypothetical protein VFI56_13670 [Vicinamibacterales bacterium]|nr:hypothetical protein [Vicinamibacterales bacterium]
MKNGTLGTLYGMAMIGAIVYFVQHAATLGAGVLGFLKGLFWPAVLMYRFLEYLKM